ncbi:hypothetical protein F4778DRAFT_749590 [Xylariomycetidae sp. FL2044]|nr:hypothetical protein F4778DRAFT_749590 [Xylariomycetidae sp. FL2044]
MCFGSKKDSSDGATAPNKPVQLPQQLPQQQQPFASSSPVPPPQFQKKKKNNGEEMTQEDYAPPPGPPPSSRLHLHGGAATVGAGSSSGYDYAPPPGPPPPAAAASSSSSSYNNNNNANYNGGDYSPPPGPPPTFSSTTTKNNPFLNNNNNNNNNRYDDGYAPPPGPPPSFAPKQHDWETAVPDTALFPPPPDIFGAYDYSPANNSTQERYKSGLEWCEKYQLLEPISEELSLGHVGMFLPDYIRDKGVVLSSHGEGVFTIKAPVIRSKGSKDNEDMCLTSWPPLYSARTHGTRLPVTIYYEVVIKKLANAVSVVALGYCAPPYPAFRLPGWHRASLGVHSDDGHRYVNDPHGGNPFTSPFKQGEVVGLGMEFFAVPDNQGQRGGGVGNKIGVNVFFTRNGKLRTNEKWDINEEKDRVLEKGVEGLQGYHDICAAVGVSGEVEVEVVFKPELCLYKLSDVGGARA